MDNLFILRAGEALINIKQKTNSYKLLAEYDNVNIMVNVIKPGSVMWITPGECHDYLEYYMILEGELLIHKEDEEVFLSAGDSFYMTLFENEILLTPLKELKLLCVTTKPVFDEFFGFVDDLNILIEQIEKTDNYTSTHCKRVMKYAVEIAKVMNLEKAQLDDIVVSALFHDIGKCHIPEELLNKPTALLSSEYEIIQCHSTYSQQLLMGHFSPTIGHIARSHHERCDGSGYPDGLTKDDICIEARIIAVADTFDAMTSERPYKNAMKFSDALRELRATSGTLYDSDVVAAFLSLFDGDQFIPSFDELGN